VVYSRRTLAGILTAVALAACGPDLSGLSAGQSGVAGPTEGPTRMRLADGGLVILAEVHAPEGAERAAEAGLAALSTGRPVRLAHGARRGLPLRGGQEAALAHVFVRSEGGRWLWAQGELVEAGLLLARPRPGEASRADALLALEEQARAARRGMWDRAEHQPRTPEILALEAAQLGDSCSRGPYRLVEGVVDHIGAGSSGMYLNFGPPGAEQQDVTARIRDTDLDAWRAAGMDVAGLGGAIVRVRGPVGYRGGPLVCLEHPLAMELLEALP
jgi:micrococcal nuclease